jgi:hypothetical protein
MKMSLAPRLAGCSGLLSILVGLPCAFPPIRRAHSRPGLAPWQKKAAGLAPVLPVDERREQWPSMAAGCKRRHPLGHQVSFKNRRRPSGSSHSDAPSGDSLGKIFSDAALPSASWRLCQERDFVIGGPALIGGRYNSLLVLADGRGFQRASRLPRQIGWATA